MTIMTLAVSERISEIGLLRALGTERRTIFKMFMFEALLLSMVGGLTGMLIGIGLIAIITIAIPPLPAEVAWEYVMASFVTSVLIGITSGVIPAMKAAQLDPVQALHTE
jgi:putative ABC transport system permease protein